MTRKQKNQWEPVGNHPDKRTAVERANHERAAAWSAFINTGTGDPRQFDHPTWLKNREKQAADQDERQRLSRSRST